jgi:hypothetical protein
MLHLEGNSTEFLHYLDGSREEHHSRLRYILLFFRGLGLGLEVGRDREEKGYGHGKMPVSTLRTLDGMVYLIV